MASDIHANFTDSVTTASDDNSNSATLRFTEGNYSLTGIVPNGRSVDASETQGSNTGLRQGARVYPQISVTAKLTDPSDAFNVLIMGKTAGFTSTTAAKGDAVTVDIDFSFDYGANSRDIVADDCLCTGFDVQEGSPSNTVQMSFIVYGKLTVDGTEWISTP